MRSRECAIGGVAALLLLSAAGSTTAAEATRFYERGAEGWFWYAPELSVAPEPEPQLTPAPPLVSETSQPEEAASAMEPTEPVPLSAAWLRANLERYQRQAIDDPTPTKVALYLYLQRITLDKASRFTDAYQRVVQSDPFLDETTRRPVGNYSNLLNRIAGQQRQAVLEDLASAAGIWFFYRSDCPYCAAQAPVLHLLSEQTGFRVQAIALDSRALPNGRFPQFRRDTGQAARLGIISTPALFLVRPPAGIVPIAQGLLSLSDLEQRLLLAAREAGWIDEAAYARTKPLVADLSLDWGLETPLSVPEDPDDFLELLRSRVAGDGVIAAPELPPTD
ncbi:conjugal transfer protein TraF [Thiorhodococcus mannitoliphagus]|uniref:Conjugal transfer protein TraF n=1 Tax=Thiorhodococcus mannitoliphagus TaxID=329406 RepID=A0A6P1DRT6_9GAMM|nr:conjugal transfer protein TraF [Thiorhodococcus mannitoliphagus]NEX19883.1 conjugal transfer protein TraF [Thiorhodococcus mannitoliphagus]